MHVTRADQRRLVIGLNEFSGYVGVALATVLTGYAATTLGARAALLWFGGLVTGVAALLAWLAVAETLPWARAKCAVPRPPRPVRRARATPSAWVPRPPLRRCSR